MLCRLACLCLMVFAQSAKGFSTTPYFPLVPGTTWTYSHESTGAGSTITVGAATIINGALAYPWMGSNGAVEWYSNDAQGIRLHGTYSPVASISGCGTGSLTTTFSPPMVVAGPDAFAGQLFTGSGTATAQTVCGSFSLSYFAFSSIADFANHQEPAGDFRAFTANLTFNLSLNGAPYATGGNSYHLSKDIGTVQAGPLLITGTSVIRTDPDSFSFPPKVGVALGSVVESDPVTVSGITRPAPISVTGGEYSINYGPWTQVQGQLEPAQNFRVRLTAPVAENTAASATLTVGGVSSGFAVVTRIDDLTPDPFSISPKTNVNLASLIESEVIVVTGIDVPVSISVAGGEYSFNGDTWISAPGTVTDGMNIKVRVVSSGLPDTQTSATLTVGGISSDFLVTTGHAAVIFTPPGGVAPQFAPQRLGTTGNAVQVLISNVGTAALTFTSIATSGVFSQTNNCPAVLAGGAICTANVLFSPNAIGTAMGILSVQGNALPGTAALSLSGSGVITPAGMAIDQFGAAGGVLTNINGADSQAWAVVAQPDDKLIAAGLANMTNTVNGVIGGFALVRYTPDGQLDPVFGSSGIVTPTQLGGDANVRALALQPDGKIVAAGYKVFFAGRAAAVVARFNTDGSLDAGFGSNGFVTPDIGSPGHDFLFALAIQSDGKIVTGGKTTGVTASGAAVLLRYNANGTLDTGFGTGGITTVQVGSCGNSINALQLLADGKILAAGGMDCRSGLMRFLPNGTLDAGFGSQGAVTTLFPGNTISAVNSLVLQSDGRIVALSDGNSGQGPLLARYEADGTLDATFGVGGIAPSSFALLSGNSAVLTTGGKIVLAGLASGGTTRFAVARYSSGGLPDATFGNNGQISFLAGMSSAGALAATVTQGNKLVLAGFGTTGGPQRFALVEITLEDILVPAPPQGVSAAATGGSRVDLAWHPSADASILTHYSVRRNGVEIATPPSPGYSNTGLQPATSYQYSIAACVGAAYCSAYVSASPVLTGPDTQAPSVPAGLTASVVSGSEIRLSWMASTDDLAVTQYRAYRGGVLQATLPAATMMLLDTGLVASTAYNYTVDACDAAGNCSAQSAQASAFTLAPGQLLIAPQPAAGWNMLGNALDLALDVSTMFGAGAGNVLSVWKWNAATQSWAFYSPQLSGPALAAYAAVHGYDVLSIIAPGEGYWINLQSAISMGSQVGRPFVYGPAAFGVLPSSWNLIAHGATETPSNFANLVSALPPPVSGVNTDGLMSLWAWQEAQQKWYFYSPQIENQAGLAGVKAYADSKGYLHFQDAGRSLDVGMGFWVNRP